MSPAASTRTSVGPERRWTHIAIVVVAGAGCQAAPATVRVSRSVDSSELVGHWALDDGSGEVAADSSGAGNAGQVDGAKWTDGIVGGALSFDGQNDAVQITEVDDFDVDAGGSISVAAWVKPYVPPEDKNNLILSKGADDFGKNYRVYLGGLGQSNLLSISLLYTDAVAGTHVYSASQAVATEEWHHVAMSATIGQPDTAVAYLDGSPVEAAWTIGDGAGAPLLNDDDLYLGSEANAGARERFLGLIDDVWLFRRTLAPEEVEELYLLGSAVAGDAGGSDAAGIGPDAGGDPGRRTLYGCSIASSRVALSSVLLVWLAGVACTRRRRHRSCR